MKKQQGSELFTAIVAAPFGAMGVRTEHGLLRELVYLPPHFLEKDAQDAVSDALETTWMAHPAAGHDIVKLRADLKAVNERLWVIEDDIRIKEKAQAFDDEFIKLARSVYFENDTRARIKKDINLALGSAYVEEKSYQDYGSGSGA